MTPADTARVLTKCAAYDQRTIGQADVLAWHEIIAGLELADALDAVRRHYRAEARRAMPADILEHAKAAKRDRERIERTGHSEALALESRYTRAAGDAAAPAYHRTAGTRTEARQRIAEAQRKHAGRTFPTPEAALAALDQALAEVIPIRPSTEEPPQ